MKLILLLILLLFPLSSWSIGMMAGVGFEITGSSESEDDRLKIESMQGVRGEVEFGWKLLTLNFSGAYAYGKTNAQYDYSKNATHLTSEDLTGNLGFLRFQGGPRFHIIHSPSLRLFVGGGGLYGGMFLTHDEDDYVARSGNHPDFKDNESQKVAGHYYEAGMDYFFNNKFGFRLLAQQTRFKSDAFETLADQRLRFEQTFFSINFVQIVSPNW